MAPVPLIPRYYLESDTPVGKRFFFPIPTDMLDDPTFPDGGEGVEWDDFRTGDRLATLSGVGRPGTYRSLPMWLVSDHRVAAVRASWSPGRAVARYAIRPLAELPETLRREADALPAVLGLDEWRALYGDDEESTDTIVGRALYQPVYEERPKRYIDWEYTGMPALPGEPDPAPDRPWRVDQPALEEFYGPHVGHLFPGYLSGFRLAVADKIKKHPMVTSCHVSMSGKISVFSRIPWDIPLERAQRKTGRDGNPLRSTEVVQDRFHSTHHVEMGVPETLQAPSKKMAMAGWDDAVEHWAARFTVPDIRACSHCHGKGFTP